MNIKIERIYEDSSEQGYRVLVDRIWPRGISRENANLNDWWKELAPSTELRKWFNHDDDKWADFRNKYLHELSGNKDKAKECLASVSKPTLVLLYGAKNKRHNQAVVLKEYFERLG